MTKATTPRRSAKPNAPQATNAKGRAPKRPTFTVHVDGSAEATTPDRDLALQIARGYFADRKTVRVTDNSARRTVARFIYGHLQ